MKDDDLTPEEIEINQIFSEADKEIEEIEKQLNNLPPDRGNSRYEYRPPGSLNTRQSNSQIIYKQHLQSLLEKKIADTKEQTAIVAERIVGPKKQQAKKTINYWQTIDDKKEKEAKKNLSRTELMIENKKDFTEPLISSGKSEILLSENKAVVETKVPMSMATRFEMSLGYTAMTEQQKDGISKENYKDDYSTPEVELSKE